MKMYPWCLTVIVFSVVWIIQLKWSAAGPTLHTYVNYQDFDGFKIPTTRRVLPLLIGNKPLSGPVIVAIDIHEFQLLSYAGI
jgi:hypothetical protein